MDGTFYKLMTAANRNDRFDLIEDDSVLDSNLNNHIHPIFQRTNFKSYHPYMAQALRLASLYLHFDSTLKWFVQPLLGKLQTTKGANGNRKCLTNPLEGKDGHERKLLIDEVRKALHCFSHCVSFQWKADTKLKITWGKTEICHDEPTHAYGCCRIFQHKQSVSITLRKNYYDYYKDKSDEGYARGSRCDRFRHDFHFATTLVHEIVHAVGVMRRGDMYEPYLQYDYPETEWGWAWENFMFGGILNPLQRHGKGTDYLVRKMWSPSGSRFKNYFATPVAWVAKWFRLETWEDIKHNGPLAVEEPEFHLKMHRDAKQRWAVFSDHPSVGQDLVELKREIMERYAVDLQADSGLPKVRGDTARMVVATRYHYLHNGRDMGWTLTERPDRVTYQNRHSYSVAAFPVASATPPASSSSTHSTSPPSANSIDGRRTTSRPSLADAWYSSPSPSSGPSSTVIQRKRRNVDYTDDESERPSKAPRRF
ncbi:hypothetical protein BDV95DRAFT_556927 [Massariosphaeria phaeospora]|uniref:Uncharacterized protein n=1 Tax=Massariosphaeria phaeospora TaxID=100035 RepID=A0A7C8MYN4_9PLEO|nr:hypothetical protein BDV95DRAFT_556927 [Massariosphaeria phaeospora]